MHPFGVNSDVNKTLPEGMFYRRIFGGGGIFPTYVQIVVSEMNYD